MDQHEDRDAAHDRDHDHDRDHVPGDPGDDVICTFEVRRVAHPGAEAPRRPDLADIDVLCRLARAGRQQPGYRVAVTAMDPAVRELIRLCGLERAVPWSDELAPP